MEVKETTGFEEQSAAGSASQIDAEEVNAFVASLFESLREKSHDAENRIKTELIPLVKQWIEDVKDMMDPNIKPYRMYLLSKPVLVGLCKQHKVDGSNGVAVYKKERNGNHYIYFAYVKDRELLPRGKNVYGVIEVKELSDDVKELFKDSSLIILI